MCQEPLTVAAWGFEVGCICGDIELGDIDWLVVGMAQEFEGKVEKSWKVVALFNVIYVVVLNFE
jgi:hypothetical protein